MIDAFDGRNFRVCEKRCNQCLFSKNKIVSEKRKADLLTGCAKKGTYFLCHKSTEAGSAVVCRGFFDTQNNQACQVAERLGLVVFVDPNTP